MKKVNLLSKAAMKKVMGGVAEEEGNGKCAVYSIAANGTRTVMFWVNASDHPETYAYNYTQQQTGNHAGWDCDGKRFVEEAV